MPRRTTWADLLKRVFGFEGLACPKCNAPLRVLCTIVAPDVIQGILACLSLPAVYRSRRTPRTYPSEEDPDPLVQPRPSCDVVPYDDADSQVVPDDDVWRDINDA